MNSAGPVREPNEAADLSRYQQAADVAYQYAKQRAQKQQGPDNSQKQAEEDQQKS